VNVKPVLTILRVVTGALFIVAGAVKVWDTQQFAIDLQNYALTNSGDLILITAVYLPWLEICAGLSLVVRRWYLGGIVALLLLDMIFIAALTSAWWRGLDITCGCFGRAVNATHFPSLIARDLLILVALAILFVTEWRRLRGSASAPTRED
jgi:hypothetical protein